jgi:sugar phosphate isomerase/epimerase
MKLSINLTTSPEDLDRFASSAELEALIRGFDGVELMYYGEDERAVIPPERVVGFHMSNHNYWLDFWRRDGEALKREYGDLDTARASFGGTLEPKRLVEEFRRDFALARRFGAAYMVYHVSDAGIEESFTRRYRHTDEEVTDAVCELVNEALADAPDTETALLLENLWLPGLRFTRPEMTRRLMEGIGYPNKGIMLDTGHLLHNDLDLQTQEEGVAYIHRLLDEHGELAKYVRGVHLNQSITSDYCRKMMEEPPELGKTYRERSWKMFSHAYNVDKHRPFTCAGVRELMDRIAPEFLTFEFITDDNAQHAQFLRAQREALGMPLFDD